MPSGPRTLTPNLLGFLESLEAVFVVHYAAYVSISTTISGTKRDGARSIMFAERSNRQTGQGKKLRGMADLACPF